MGRYDQKRNDKSSKVPFFIIAMLTALLIGGAWSLKDQFRTLMVADTRVSDTTPAKEVAATEGFPDERQAPEDEQLEFLPMEPGADALAGDTGQALGQQSGLPDLLSSDDLVRQTLIKLSPGLAYWLNVDQLLRKFMVITNDFSQGYRIANHMSFLRFEEPFSVEQGENGEYIAPKSFHRYDKLAQTIQAIDAKAAVAVYQKFRPLMLQVFAEFSYPKDITLETVVKKAAAEMLAAPAIEGQIILTRPSVRYKFADAKLEALSPVQKQMIRMGSGNMRIVQAKCREFLVELAKVDLNS